MWCTVVRSVNSSARKPKYEPQTCHLLAEWLWPGYRTSLYLVYKVNVVSFMCGDYGKWSLDSYFILTSSSCPIPVSPAILDRTPWGKTTASENQQENKSLLAQHCPMSAGLLQQSPNWSPLFPLSSLSTQQTARCCVWFFSTAQSFKEIRSCWTPLKPFKGFPCSYSKTQNLHPGVQPAPLTSALATFLLAYRTLNTPISRSEDLCTYWCFFFSAGKALFPIPITVSYSSFRSQINITM